MVVEIEFACPACSNYFGKLYTLNSISQSTDHFKGIKHERIMRRIGPVLTRGMLYNFFKLLGPCGSKYIDYIDAGTKPIDVFRDYAHLCVAAPDMTLSYLAPPPLPLKDPSARVPPKANSLKKYIKSPCYAWHVHKPNHWIRLLCCFDDPHNLGSRCIRGDTCPYLHSSTLQKQFHPGAEPQDLFRTIPCCMAGMPGGACFHHGDRLGSHDWIVPRFQAAHELAAEDKPATELPDEGREYILEYTFGVWALAPITDRAIANEIREAVSKFCLHEDEEDTG